MKNNNKKITLIFRILLLIIINIGLVLNFLAKGKNWNLVLSYYTIQSNIIVCIFLILQIINYFKPINLFQKEITFQNIKGMITIIILITGLIFAIILAPYVRDWNGLRLYSSYILHYISPIAVLIDFIFFDNISEKLLFKKNIIWLIYPITYYIIGIIRILYIDGFIPYPFMDIKQLGAIKSILIVVVLITIFYSISILLVVLKNKLCKVNENKN